MKKTLSLIIMAVVAVLMSFAASSSFPLKMRLRTSAKRPSDLVLLFW